MIRVFSNFARLTLTFGLGILVVRLMGEIGADAVLVYLLLISSTGIAAMFKFALQNALVPALGLSIDGNGPHRFLQVLWTSFLFGIGAGLFSVLLFGLFWAFSDDLNFGHLTPRTIAIALSGTTVQAFASSVGVVFLNLILVEKRIVTYNALIVLERLFVFVAAGIAFLLPAGLSIDERVQVFYILVGALAVLLQLVTYALVARGKPENRLTKAPLRPQTTSWIAKLVAWNAVVVISFALFTRWPPLIINWSIGETMTLTIGIVLALIGYQRQISMGLVVGLDAMVSRFVGGNSKDGHANARSLMLRSTYILSAFAAFSVVLIGLFVEQILSLWLGDTLTGSGWSTEFSAQLFRIMSFGIAVSIVSEGWMKFLSGRGELVAFAPHLLVAGVVNAIAVVVSAQLLEAEDALRVIAFVFSASLTIVNLGFMARNVARRLEIGLGRFFLIMAIPALAAALAAIPATVMHHMGGDLLETTLTIALLSLMGLGTLLAMPRVLARLSR